ncbi:MAG: alpha/beta hydrolase [Gammaproteobacteria bacterium]|nr:alpha/beta hydrolase [Gammaproteobacteria bacterium]
MLKKILLVLSGVIAVLVIVLAVFLSGGPQLPDGADEIISRSIVKGPPNLAKGRSGYARNGDITIWYETVLPATAPQADVLLVMGAGVSSMFWPLELIDTLTAQGYRVIRYDHRGIGLSDWMEQWQADAPYSLEDMTGDALAVLDAAAARKAHVIGVSMGGMIGQRLAISHPDRVLSLVSMSTSAHMFDPEFADQQQQIALESVRLVLKYGLTGSEADMIRMMSGFIGFMMPEGLDNDVVQSIADLVLYEMRHRKGFNPGVMPQHFRAMEVSGSRLDELGRIQCPVLVVHGTADPSVTIDHARKYAARINSVQTLWLDGAGHMIRDEHMPAMMAAIFSLFLSASPGPGQDQ